MKIDVIVPTYNSGHVLPATLKALAGQRVPSGWTARVVVSDDGSDISPEEVVRSIVWSRPWVSPVVLSGSHAGVSHARNVAIDISDADILLFLGADIILRPGSIARHCNAYKDPHVTAALGMVMWDPRLRPTPLMEWMVHGGPQNDFDALLGMRNADIRQYWYGSHLSCRRGALQQQRFPDVYQAYGWEDLDMGRSLHASGVSLTVLQDAVGLHSHMYTAKAIQQRQYSVGQGMDVYAARYPEASLMSAESWWRGMKVFIYRYLGVRWLLWRCVAMLGGKYALPRLFLYSTAAEFWYGWYKGRGKNSQKGLYKE